MTTYTNICIEGKLNEDAAGLEARERDRSLQYHSPETTSGLEEVEKTGINLAQGNPDGDKKETSKEKSAIEYEGIKDFLEYIITKQNKTLTDKIKENRKALQDSITETAEVQKDLRNKMTEIEKSVKRSELETQRMNRELLDRFGSKTSKCNHLIRQVPKETEV
jgi:DNA-binding transcriptional regulator GbsR (MarR family)